MPTVQEELTGREYTSEMRQGVIHDTKCIIVKTCGDVACLSMVVQIEILGRGDSCQELILRGMIHTSVSACESFRFVVVSKMIRFLPRTWQHDLHVRNCGMDYLGRNMKWW
jgi:hypothetical protein